MKNKKVVLNELRELINSGELTTDEVRKVIGDKESSPSQTKLLEDTSSSIKISKPSAIDVMFIIGGIILFVAIQVLIEQLSGSSSPGTTGAIICMVVAILLWAVAYLQSKQKQVSEAGRGTALSFVLTGSLLLVAAAVYAAIEVTEKVFQGYGSNGASQLYVFGVGMIVVTLFHVLYARAVKRQIVAAMAVLVANTALTTLLLGFLVDNKVDSTNIYVLAFVGSGALLYALTRTVSQAAPTLLRPNVFDGLAQFVVLAAMTVGTFGELSLLWYILVIGSVLGLIYMSIIQKSQTSLTIAAFFLTVTLISMSFRYFNGFGVAFSLLMAATAVLGVATVAVSIRKKYLS